MPQNQKRNKTVVDTYPVIAEPAFISTPLQEQAYLRLKEMIESGQIQAGDRLLEAQVANAFGISRSPARRALALLCEENLLEAHGKRGYHVAGKIVEGASIGRPAPLGAIKLTVPRQWEVIYKQVEQELFMVMLFESVRINDVRLAQHYDVSRTVTRDLLAHMHGVGMVAKDAVGHWVARRLTPERIRHLYHLRAILEPIALVGAATYIPRSVLEGFQANIRLAFDSSPPDSDLFDQIENDLHIRALGFCPNKEIMMALSRTHFLFGPTRYLSNQLLGIPLDMIRAAISEHSAIIELLLEGKPKRAAQALHKHLDVAVDRWLLRFEAKSEPIRIKLPPYLAKVE
jgi:DNA-binding GntR family transcriptional regulator